MENTYLVHHGVKGMKWGVRNAETLRKYGGTKTLRRDKRSAHKAVRDDYIKIQKDINTRKKNAYKEAKASGLKGFGLRAAKAQIRERAVGESQRNLNLADVRNYEIVKAYQRARVEDLLTRYPPDSRKVIRAKKRADSAFASYGNATVYKDPNTGKYQITRTYYA